MEKRILCPARVRRVPPHFSWVDHRLVRDGHMAGPGPEALALYLALVSVGDADGVSWYSTGLLARLLGLEYTRVDRARQALTERSLIAFEAPFYQVLSLEPSPAAELARVLEGGVGEGDRT
ncbi:MAG: hypothetical protein ACOYOU_14945 [Kiritimatiellia bacterium]